MKSWLNPYTLIQQMKRNFSFRLCSHGYRQRQEGNGDGKFPQQLLLSNYIKAINSHCCCSSGNVLCLKQGGIVRAQIRKGRWLSSWGQLQQEAAEHWAIFILITCIIIIIMIIIIQQHYYYSAALLFNNYYYYHYYSASLLLNNDYSYYDDHHY